MGTVTAMCVLLSVLHVCMLSVRVQDNAGAGDGGVVVMVSAGYVDGARGSGIVSNTADVLFRRTTSVMASQLKSQDP